MRKSVTKLMVLATVLAMATVAVSALAADKQQKKDPSAPTMTWTMKEAPDDMKPCGMAGGAAGKMVMCGKAGEMACCGNCCCMQGGGMKGCGMKGGKSAGMKCGGGMSACGMHGEMAGMGAGPMGCGMGMGPGAMGCGMGKGAGAMSHGMGPGCGAGLGCGPAMLHGLGLTADQQKKVEAIHDRQARQNVQAEADLKIARMDLHKLMSAESPDRARIEAQVDRIAALEAGQQKSHIATHLEVRALLTPEQLKKLQAGPACEDVKVKVQVEKVAK